jgi:hypothetical protein
MRSVTVAATATTVLAAACLMTAAPATAAADTGPGTTVTRSAHVTFENCNARHVILSVIVPRHAFTHSDAVTYTVRLHNSGSTTCGPPVARVPQARPSFTVGPCGTLTAVVRNALGVNVYPGPGAFNCPDELGVRLGPRSTASTTGTWNQTEVLGSPPQSRQAPPGTYRLVVGRAVTVPVTLVPG